MSLPPGFALGALRMQTHIIYIIATPRLARLTGRYGMMKFTTSCSTTML